METIYLLILFFGGICIGLFASTTGSGGLVSLPLLLLTGLPVHQAIATSRLGGIFLELGSGAKFYKEKKLNLGLAFLFGFLASIGSIIGAYLLLNIEEKYLQLITPVLLIFIFCILMFKKQLGLRVKKINHTHWIIAGILTFLLGIYGGFFGAGFGTLITFILLLTGLDFIKSAAISRIIGMMMCIASTAIFALNGLIDYGYGMTIGIGMAIGGWVGAGIAIKQGNKYIRVLFILVLAVTVIKLLNDFLS